MVYRAGQFIFYQQRVVRLLCCLVHKIDNQEYFFPLVQELERSVPSSDFVLNLPRYQLTDRWFFIGHQSLTSPPLFFIDLSCSSGVSRSSSSFVHCTWNVDYL